MRNKNANLFMGYSITELLIVIVFFLLIAGSLELNEITSLKSKISDLRNDIGQLSNKLSQFNKKIEEILLKFGVTDFDKYPDYWSKLVCVDKLAEKYKKMILLVAENKMLKEELSKKTSKINYLKGKIGKGGIDECPCWLNGNGKVEYLFIIEMVDDVFILQNCFSESFKKQTSKFNIPYIENDNKVKLNINEFKAVASKIYDKSVENECRHFVKVIDSTSSKQYYVSQLELIENFFYKLIIDRRPLRKMKNLANH